MFIFGYDYVNMNIFVTTEVTNVVLEPFCKVKPYLRRKFLEEQMRICLEPFLCYSLAKTFFCYFWRKFLTVFSDKCVRPN